MAITANYTTLLDQASGTADTYLREAVHNIDRALGDGYAAKHPELIAAMIRTASSDFNTSALIVAIQEASAELAEALRRGA